MSTGRRFWRWRRNPLKRDSDRAEAWALLASGLLLAVGTPTVGVGTGLVVMAHAPRPPADWHRVTAVLIRDAPPPSVVTSVGSGSRTEPVRATVRWRMASGRDRTGSVLVRPDSPEGSHTTIWLDRTGAVRQNPADLLRARSDAAITYGILASSGTALFASGSCALVRCALDRRRAADLDHEWAQTGPEWRRHRA